MRVVDRNPAAPISSAGSAQRAASAAGSRFSLGSSSGPGRATQTNAMLPASALDALLTVQAAGDALERRKRAMRRGRGLLDGLDELKIALLSGRVAPGTLERLKAQLRSQGDQVEDPALADILAHIELRAEVELAKLARG